MTTDADRRANLHLAVDARDELLDLAAGAVAGELSLRAAAELHESIVMFLDGVHCRRHPGVAARLRSGLEALGWTYERGVQAVRAYADSMKPALLEGVTEETKCQRCGGVGYLSAYKHINGGECFDCVGSGRAGEAGR